ncbi:relaxase/mobilization nuclease domain-containing protein [Mucilaginibacter gracilis]|nr:relaxase/mobilization nuclease domain-containing protein [Mucilaginibacter gracilis]
MKKEATILDADGIRIDNIAHTINDFNMQRKMNPNLGQAVGHIALSWSENDIPKLNDEVMTDIAKEYLQKMKIQETQVLIVRHQDKCHPHLHIIYNRVDNNGKTIRDNFQHIKNIKVAKELTLKYGFFMAENKMQVNRQQLKGADKVKYELFDTIKQLSKQVRSLDELKQILSTRGVEMIYKFKSGTKEVQGISFSKGEYKFKGSEIDRSLSFGRLTQAIEQNKWQNESEQAKQQQPTHEPKQIQIPIYTQPLNTGCKSLLEVLLEPDYVDPMPNIYDTDERKRKRKKKPHESHKISR